MTWLIELIFIILLLLERKRKEIAFILFYAVAAATGEMVGLCTPRDTKGSYFKNLVLDFDSEY